MGIRWRLALWYGGVFAVAVSLMVLFNYATYTDEQYRAVDRQMRRGALQFQTEWAKNNPLPLTNFFSENYTVIRRYDRAGQLLDSSHPWVVLLPNNPQQLLQLPPPTDWVSRLRRWIRPQVETPPGAVFVTVSLEDQRWRIYVYTLRTSTGGYLELMVPLGDLDARIGQVGRNLILAGLTVLALMLLGGWLIARRVLQPITRLTRTAHHVAQSGDLSRRVKVPKGRDELSQLARTFNAMLDQIETSMHKERQVAAQLEATFKNLPVGIALLDRDLRYVNVNPLLAEINQMSVEEHLGRTLEEVLPSASKAMRPYMQQVLHSGQAITNVELSGPRNRQPDQIGHALVSWFPIQQNGETVMVGAVVQDITERKQIEAALLESEERFRLMADAAPMLVWVTDQQGNSLFINSRWYEYSGAPQRATAEEIAAESLHPEDAPKVMAAFEEAKRSGKSFEIEQRTRSATGEYRWFLNRAEPYRDSRTGQITRWFGVAMDINDRKLTEEALRRTTDDLRTVLNTVPIGIALSTDPLVQEVRMNPAGARMLGIPTEENASKSRPDADQLPFRVLKDGVEVSADQLPMQVAAVRGEELRDLEYQIVYSDGSQTDLLEYATPLFDDSGKVRGCVGVFVDITQRKRAEAALRQSEQRLELAVRSAGIGIFDWDIKADLLHWSVMEHRLFGLAPEQFGGRFADWGAMVLPADRERVEAAMQLAMGEQREGMDFAFRIRRANDAAIRHIEGTARFIYDAKGQPERMVGVNTDVSERIKALESLRQSEARLRALVESQKRFVADASHELRAPLTSIQGNLELLQRFKNMTIADREAAINEAAREAARLGRLVSDLLALARGDAGTQLELTPTDWGEVVQEALSEMQHLAGGKAVVVVPMTALKVMGHRDRLKQLAIILIENALKYTPNGGTVRLELQHDGSRAELRISDNGIGISPEDLPHVFERFYRADHSRSKTSALGVSDPGGTGLGLPIAQWIVEQHGGQIRLESQLGAGTTAIVELPLMQLSPTS